MWETREEILFLLKNKDFVFHLVMRFCFQNIQPIVTIKIALFLTLLMVANGCEKHKRVAAVTTVGVNHLSYTSCYATGYMLDLGEAGIDQHGFVWSFTENPTLNNSTIDLGSTETLGAFDHSLTGLTAGTKYYIRAYALNGNGEFYGKQMSFTTLSFDIPSVITRNADSISTTTASVGGKVINDGGYAVSERGIYYGTTDDVETTGTRLVIGSGTGEFSTSLTGLTPATTYYIKAYATNSLGKAFGETRSFITREYEIGNIMKIHDITAQAGEILTLELEILNEEDFVGFNLDITLPEGFEYITDSEELFRSDDHILSMTVMEGNIVRMISGSPENNPYTGNEGIILSFNLESPETSGNYAFEIQNAVIGSSDAVNILTETIDGNVVLE